MSVPLDRFFAVFKWMLPIYSVLHFAPAILFKWKASIRDPGKVLVRSGLGSLRSSAFLGVFVVIYQGKLTSMLIDHSLIDMYAPGLFCYKHKLHKILTELKASPSASSNPLSKIPQHIIDFLVSNTSFWLAGFAAGLSLFVEEKRRRGELAMYVLPKALESLWVTARGKGLVFRTGKWGEPLVSARTAWQRSEFDDIILIVDYDWYGNGHGMSLYFIMSQGGTKFLFQSTYQNDPQHLSGLVRRILYQFIGPN